jgi:hypothetical protein
MTPDFHPQVLEQNPHGLFSVVGVSPPQEGHPTERKITASTKNGLDPS